MRCYKGVTLDEQVARLGQDTREALLNALLAAARPAWNATSMP